MTDSRRGKRPRKAPSQKPPDPPRPNPIVGMGASAGGLDALQRFFGRLRPDTDMAFVVVQHLDPRHPTLLPELLVKSTQMSVEQVKDETPVQPNHVYVIPPNATLTVERGMLRVRSSVDARSQRNPIDSLFYSLAQEQGLNTVCILLSGSGSDGTLGLRAVKEHGGMVMAQSPDSAQHDAMLRSAIATGLVDHVLPPEELAEKLHEYGSYLRSLSFGEDRGAGAGEGEGEGISISRDELTRICAVLRRKTGHDFNQYKVGTLTRRIQRRMQVRQSRTVVAYLDLMRQEAAEVDQLFRDFLIGVTHFFRDPASFKALDRLVIKPLVEEIADEATLRVWTPGCATGEEAYSVAMLLQEAMQRANRRCKAQVFAGDIDEEALEFARQGRYPHGISQYMSPERLERFFTGANHGYQVRPEIRDMCIFSTHNLIKDPPFSRLDLVVCRNLLIYLESDLQRHVIGLLHYSLRRGGYLFLGPSESVDATPELFRTIDRKHRLFQRAEPIVRRPPVPPALVLEAVPRVIQRLNRPQPPGRQTPEGPQVVGVFERVLLEQYTPAWVVVTASGDCLYFSPRTGKYLQPAPGVPSADVVSMAREGLRLNLRAAIHKAVKTGELVVHEDIDVETNGDVQRINLVVRPVPELGAQAGLFLIVFQEQGPARSRKAAAKPKVLHGSDAIMQQLESELRSTKESLQASLEDVETSNEELKSSNEELLSTNEELQSANEELQTSKEELQSVNEELETVNAELNKKILEVDRANNDLENLFHATQIPTLFLDSELRIKRFTQAATSVFRLIETDVGRPIADIAGRFKGDLLADMNDVLRSLTSKTREVHLADNSTTYIVRILPYRRAGNVIDGLVITFLDVTQLQLVQEQRARLAGIVESSHDPIVSSTFDGIITSWNAAATKLFGFTEKEAVGHSMRMIAPPKAWSVLQTIEGRLRRGEEVEPFESVCRTKDGQEVAVWVAISHVRERDGTLLGTAAIFRDLTDLKRASFAEEETRRRDELLSVLSHELREPLASLGLSIDILKEKGVEPGPGRAALETAGRQVKNMAAMVDQMLDSSRVARGNITLNKRTEDLVSVVRIATDDQRPVLHAADIQLALELPSDPILVQCDRLRITQVLISLLSNAAKFSNIGGTVTVAVRATDDRTSATISVRDQGVGIDPSVLPRLFYPYDGRPSTEAVPEGRRGLGLGLALSQALVEAHGGTIEAKSAGRGQGAEFIVRLPLIVAHSGDREGLPPPAGRAQRILVVEDNADTAGTLRALLEMNGHMVEVARNAEVALTAVSAFRPDVVICDIALPGELDGYGFVERLRQGRDGQPYLIAYTGYAVAADKVRAIGAGFDRHIPKADPPRTLLSAIAEASLRRGDGGP